MHTLIPKQAITSLLFIAPVWGISSRGLNSNHELTWVQLVVDLGVQIYVWVLAPTDNVPELKKRTTRSLTLKHTADGLLIKEIQTSGLAANEVHGYTDALGPPSI